MKEDRIEDVSEGSFPRTASLVRHGLDQSYSPSTTSITITPGIVYFRACNSATAPTIGAAPIE